jgi:hypothetical protein
MRQDIAMVKQDALAVLSLLIRFFKTPIRPEPTVESQVLGLISSWLNRGHREFPPFLSDYAKKTEAFAHAITIHQARPCNH